MAMSMCNQVFCYVWEDNIQTTLVWRMGERNFKGEMFSYLNVIKILARNKEKRGKDNQKKEK